MANIIEFDKRRRGGMDISRKRIEEIRYMIETEHKDSNGGGGFGETFCAHIHTYDLGFIDLAQHFGITLAELAEVTADHIRRLE